MTILKMKTPIAINAAKNMFQNKVKFYAVPSLSKRNELAYVNGTIANG